jgi:hypothetical protein
MAGQGFTLGIGHEARTLDAPLKLVESGYIDDLNRVTFKDDFGGDTLNTNDWLVTVEADGTDQSAVAIAEAAGGTVAMSLGSTANDFANLAGAKIFSTSENGRLDCRVKVTDGANAIDNLFIGLSDAKTESNGNLITDFSTPTVVPDDCIGFASNGTNWYACTANNTVDTAFSLSGLADAPSTTYQKLSIVWKTDLSVDFYVDNVLVKTLENAYRAGQVLCPIIAATHVGGTGDPVITVDYIFVTQERV